MKNPEPIPFSLKPFPNGSSNLMGWDYHRESNTLTIQFKFGKTYQYAKVPEQVFKELLAAESHGKYFTQSIKTLYHYISV